MDDLIQLLKQRVADAENEMRRQNEQMERLHNEIQITTRNVHSYRDVLEAEMRKLGLPTANGHAAASQDDPRVAPVGVTRDDAPTGPSPAPDKTQVVMQIIKDKGGATSQDIVAALHRMGSAIDNAYVYAVVSRQRKKGKLKVVNNKYFIP